MNKLPVRLINRKKLCFNLSRFLTSDNRFSLENHLINKIKLKGPISVADYMKEVLGNANEVMFNFQKCSAFLLQQA